MADYDPASESGQNDDDELELLRGRTLAQMVEHAVFVGVDLQMVAYIGGERVTITVESEGIDDPESPVLH